MSYFIKLPLRVGNQLILKAYIETQKALAWSVWVEQNSKNEKFVPFSEYFEAHKEDTKPKHKPSQQLLQDAADIVRRIQAGGGKDANI